MKNVILHRTTTKYKLADVAQWGGKSYIVTKCILNDDGTNTYELTSAEKILEALDIMRKHDNDIKRNASGYYDPTAYQAIKNIDDESKRFSKLMGAIFNLCECTGFHLEGRITVKDNRTGKVWR